MSGSIPIYWGNDPTVNFFFNHESFINVNNFYNFDHAIDYISNVWKDKQKYQKFFDVSIYNNNHLSEYEAVYNEYKTWQKPMVDILKDTFPDFN